MPETSRALIIDDEADIRELLDITLSRMGLDVVTVGDCASARSALSDETFDLCFTDMRLPDGSGLDIVRHIASHHTGLPTAVITAHGNTQDAVEALKSGAFDFVSKPVDLNVLRSLVNSALKVSTPRQPALTQQTTTKLIGSSDPMMAVRKTIAKLARSQAPVYISGESGTGKELAAQMIHDLGPRAEGPFVPVNCGAIPSELMESELFGHKKGSFTGANADKAGLFETAGGGTLFLDEVAELPLHMQVKLLRVIQEKTVRPIGATSEKAVDVRILSATHKNLMDLVESGAFRQDLYYRLNVIELKIPPLRERQGDMLELADHFLNHIAREWQVDRTLLSDTARQALQSYAFPGNVRELQNILERAVTLCEGDTIEADDLQLGQAGSIADEMAHLERGEQPLEEFIADIERQAIEKALQQTRYNKTAAAKKLGITFRALRYRLKKLGME